MAKVGEPKWRRRWTIGSGGFIGEVTLVNLHDIEAPLLTHEGFVQKSTWGKKTVALTNLYVHPQRRNCGWSVKLLTTATEYASRYDVILVLEAAPYGTIPGTPLCTLYKLYERFGFKKVAGTNLMVRRP